MSDVKLVARFSFLAFVVACGSSASRGAVSRPERSSIENASGVLRSSVPPASELVQRGENHLAVNELAQARSLFEQALVDDSNDARANLDLGIVMEMLGDIEAAETQYRKAIAIQPDFAEALNNLGVLLRVKRELDEAVLVLRKAVRYNPSSASGHMNLALALEDSALLEQAEAEYREALRVNPNDAITRANLGLLLLRMEQRDAAARELKIALSQAADNRAALVAIGNGLRRAGEPSGALQALQAAIRADGAEPTPSLLSELALAQRAAGDRDEAIRSLRRALEIDENYAIAHYLMANMLAAKRASAEAAKHYQIYLQLEPKGAQAERARERLKLIRQQ